MVTQQDSLIVAVFVTQFLVKSAHGGSQKEPLLHWSFCRTQQQANASCLVYSLEDKIPVHSCSSLANKHDLDFFS